MKKAAANMTLLVMAFVIAGIISSVVQPIIHQWIHGVPKKKPCGCGGKKPAPAVPSESLTATPQDNEARN